MTVQIRCDRCGILDDRHWGLDVSVKRGSYASTLAPKYTWELNAHICGYCTSSLRDWWNGKPS